MTKFEFFVLRWTDGRGAPNRVWYDGRSGAGCLAEDAKQWKTRQGAEKAAKRHDLPREVVRFVAAEEPT